MFFHGGLFGFCPWLISSAYKPWDLHNGWLYSIAEMVLLLMQFSRVSLFGFWFNLGCTKRRALILAFGKGCYAYLLRSS